MKDRKQQTVYSAASSPMVLKDAMMAPEQKEMVRTQIYLTRNQHQFLLAEGARRGVPMAAVLRDLVDCQMSIPADAWTNNPLMDPPADPDFRGPEDGVINHDHYIHGTPKRYIRRKGKWAPSPELPEDYYQNESSRRAYDSLVSKET